MLATLKKTSNIEVKLFKVIMFFFFSTISYGQNTLPNMKEKIVINDSLSAKPGETYIDGIKVESDKIIIHENNIEDIKVYKGESAKTYSGARGTTVISRKNKYEFVLLSKFISDLKRADKNLKGEQNIELMINDILIAKANEYRIELNPEIKITIQNYSDDGIYRGGKTNKPKTRIIIQTQNSNN